MAQYLSFHNKIIVITWKLMKIHLLEFQIFSNVFFEKFEISFKKINFWDLSKQNASEFCQCSSKRIRMSFNAFPMIFYGKRGENSYFSNQKFFTPLTSFLPPFLHEDIWHVWKIGNFVIYLTHKPDKKGVKN